MSRYYCVHGSYSEYDRQRCKPCKERARVLAQGDLRSCADCVSYVPVSTMIEQSDGRVICKRCAQSAKDKASDRAQLAFFGQQSLI